jgi:secondary thiamine-phosphate synthase enzyme
MPISTNSPTFTLLIVLLLAVCLFPNLFNFILYTSIYPILYFFPPPPSLSLSPSTPTMSWFQKTLSLPPKSRGSYLITDTIVRELPELKSYKVGILHLFMQHTSAALSLNENWDEDVRADMSDALDRIVPEDRKGDMYRHSCEGSDDMPVCYFRPARPGSGGGCRRESDLLSNDSIGTCKERAYRGERDHPY